MSCGFTFPGSAPVLHQDGSQVTHIKDLSSSGTLLITACGQFSLIYIFEQNPGPPMLDLKRADEGREGGLAHFH